MIYKRFTEKSAEEWRQIYKALQLLEFLIKHGSERVIDDARSHLSLLKMLRQFHFIDQNGKDQGVNVRNRSKELVELLSDVDKIRAERKKARATRNKYGGYEGGGSALGGMGGSSSRYGGFGSENAGYGGYSGGVYGDGGGFGGQASDYQDTQARRDRFEEYDEDDDDAAVSRTVRQTAASSPRAPRKTEAAKPKEPEVDLFSFDDTEPAASTSNGKAAAASDFGALQSGAGEEDDFDDFQSAAPPAPAAAPTASAFSIPPPASTSTTTSSTQFAAPQPIQPARPHNLNALFPSISPPPGATSSTSTPSLVSPPAPTTTTAAAAQFKPAAPAAPQPTGYMPNQPNYFQSVSAQPTSSPGTSTPIQTSMASLGKPVAGPPGGAKKAGAGGDAFASLLGASKKRVQAGGKVSLAEAQRQKASAGIWGAGSTVGGSGAGTPAPAQGGQQQKSGGGMDDLLGL